MTIQMKAVVHYFPAELFIMFNKVVLLLLESEIVKSAS